MLNLKSIGGHLWTALITSLLLLSLVGDRLRAQRPAPPIPQPFRGPALAPPQAPAGGARFALPKLAPPPMPEDVLKAFDADEQVNIRVYAAVNRSVVNITTASEPGGFLGEESSGGTGSGFVIDKQGHILTNYHVIEGAQSVQVTLFDGSTHDAEVIGEDASNDVAVVQLRGGADRLVPVALGDSSKLLVGQKILALGNPFGLERTLTTGIISSLDRSLRAKNGRMIKEIIQTDAAINPGNSGGPLLNSRGEVIGMNTAIISQVGQSAGISFAVPINAITRILKPLIEHGRVIRADLGITRVYATGEGLLVVAMVEGGPAEAAGIQAAQLREQRVGPGFIRPYLDTDSADVIVAIEHKRVKTVEELLTEVEKHQPGATIRVTVVREGRPVDVRVQLGRS